jgi:hypothetical protein
MHDISYLLVVPPMMHQLILAGGLNVVESRSIHRANSWRFQRNHAEAKNDSTRSFTWQARIP